MDVDSKNRATLRQGPPLEDSAMDLMEGLWKFTDKDLADEGAETNHRENVDKRRHYGVG